MQEYVSLAIVLNKEPLGDLDGRYALFTERFGKVIGKTKSSRKITSKLAPHLEPGTLARVRFIERNGTQIVDALKEKAIGANATDLSNLHRILPEALPEEDLWTLLAHGSFAWPEILRILGWDPEGAQCAVCRRSTVTHFHIPRQDFFCEKCALRLRKNEVILVRNGLQPELPVGK